MGGGGREESKALGLDYLNATSACNYAVVWWSLGDQGC